MSSAATGTAREQLNRPVTPELYDQVRRLWIRHSIAEDRRDLDGLIETLAPGCVYEVMPTGQRWQGHDGARAFYQSFLAAFPDVRFELRDIVIGPQGVIEVAEMAGTQLGPWAGAAPTGRPVRLLLVIHFPWDSAVGKFGGERIYFDRMALAAPAPSDEASA
jgi:predicted ester cyclase